MDKLLIKLVNTNLEFVKTEILTNIQNEIVKDSALEVMQRIIETVKVLSDDNTDNKQQLIEIWTSVTSDPEVIQILNKLLSNATSSIKDENIKKGLSLLQTPIIATFVSLTDNVNQNDEQIKKIWVDFIDSPEFIAFILSNLEWIIKKVIKNDNLETIIITLLRTFKK